MELEKKNIYNHSKIYKLLCNSGYFYIGCTTVSLSTRLQGHKARSKGLSNMKVYNYINSIGLENVKIVLISEHCFDNREQLLRAETELIMQFINDPLCLNSHLSKVTEEERKAKDKETAKIYNENNKEKLKEKSRIYRENNIEKYREYDRLRWINNKEKEQERSRIYREKNKEKIKEKWAKNSEERYKKDKEKYECECGSITRIRDKVKHVKTKKHIDYINQNSDEKIDYPIINKYICECGSSVRDKSQHLISKKHIDYVNSKECISDESSIDSKIE